MKINYEQAEKGYWAGYAADFSTRSASDGSRADWKQSPFHSASVPRSNFSPCCNLLGEKKLRKSKIPAPDQ
jgi:hypothetical protein